MQTVGIYLYNNMEVLDFAVPFEVFSTAQRLYSLQGEGPSDKLFEVIITAEKQSEIIARGGLKVMPMYGIDYHPHIDVLIIPGGVVTAQMNKQNILSWIRSTSERANITASIGTGVFILAAAGLVEEMEVTTHWEDIEELKKAYPDLIIKENVRWVDNGHILTSAGISAGIDMSLYLVSRVAGMDHAKLTARQLEYNWQLN